MFTIRRHLHLLATCALACLLYPAASNARINLHQGEYHGVIRSDVLGSTVVSGKVKKRNISLRYHSIGGATGSIKGTLTANNRLCMNGRVALGKKSKPFRLVNCSYDVSSHVLTASIKTPSRSLEKTVSKASISLLGAIASPGSNSITLADTSAIPLTSGALISDWDYSDTTGKGGKNSTTTLSKNDNSLFISSIIGGAFFGHLVSTHNPNIMIDRDRNHLSLLGHMIKESGSYWLCDSPSISTTCYVSGTNQVPAGSSYFGSQKYYPIVKDSNIDLLNTGGVYQINDWYKPIFNWSHWDSSLGTMVNPQWGLPNMVSMQGVLAPLLTLADMVATNGQAINSGLSQYFLNDVYSAPVIMAYRKYLALLGLEFLANPKKTPNVAGSVYDMNSCENNMSYSALNAMNSPQESNILDMIMTSAFNSGANFVTTSNETDPATAAQFITGSMIRLCNENKPSYVAQSSCNWLQNTPGSYTPTPADIIACGLNNASIVTSNTNPGATTGIASCTATPSASWASSGYCSILSITNALFLAGGDEYPFWDDYARSVRLTTNELTTSLDGASLLKNTLLGAVDGNIGSAKNVLPNSENPDITQFPDDVIKLLQSVPPRLVFSLTDIHDVFVLSMNQLTYLKNTTPMTLARISTSDASAAFNAALARHAFTNAYVQLSDPSDRSALFDLLDDSISTLESNLLTFNIRSQDGSCNKYLFNYVTQTDYTGSSPNITEPNYPDIYCTGN